MTDYRTSAPSALPLGTLARELARALDCARCVVFDEDTELIGAWFGGSTFNIYNIDGDALDAFTVYDCDAQTAQAALIEHMRPDEETDR